jgi:hypothetical protein
MDRAVEHSAGIFGHSLQDGWDEYYDMRPARASLAIQID